MTGMPCGEFVDLDGGGTIQLTLFPDGHIRLAIEKGEIRISVPLTLRDTRSLRHAALGINLAHHLRGIIT